MDRSFTCDIATGEMKLRYQSFLFGIYTYDQFIQSRNFFCINFIRYRRS